MRATPFRQRQRMTMMGTSRNPQKAVEVPVTNTTACGRRWRIHATSLAGGKLEPPAPEGALRGAVEEDAPSIFSIFETMRRSNSTSVSFSHCVQSHSSTRHHHVGCYNCTTEDSLWCESSNNNDQLCPAVFAPKLDFPVKLHLLLEDAANEGAEDIVSWLPDGKGFKVHAKELFETEIIRRYFTSTAGSPKYRSFQRQLAIYGFVMERTRLSPFFGAYRHPLFVRGNPGLCVGMKRRTVKNTTTRAKSPGVALDRQLGNEGCNKSIPFPATSEEKCKSFLQEFEATAGTTADDGGGLCNQEENHVVFFAPHHSYSSCPDLAGQTINAHSSSSVVTSIGTTTSTAVVCGSEELQDYQPRLLQTNREDDFLLRFAIESNQFLSKYSAIPAHQEQQHSTTIESSMRPSSRWDLFVEAQQWHQSRAASFTPMEQVYQQQQEQQRRRLEKNRGDDVLLWFAIESNQFLNECSSSEMPPHQQRHSSSSTLESSMRRPSSNDTFLLDAQQQQQQKNQAAPNATSSPHEMGTRSNGDSLFSLLAKGDQGDEW